VEPVLTDGWRVLRPRCPARDSLNQLTAKDKQVEMEFYLPIASPLNRAS
jgi:exodeoxyribonuclease V beta subunit